MFRYWLDHVRYLTPRGGLAAGVWRRLSLLPVGGRPLRGRAVRRLLLAYIRRKAVDLRPVNFSLETLNACNARCTMCRIPSMARRTELLPWDLFARAVDGAVGSFRPKAFFLAGTGEPLLADDLAARVRYVKDRSRAAVRLFTNGSLLTAAGAEELVASGVDEVSVSLNAVSEGTRRQIMGLPLAPAEEGVRALLEARRRRGSHRPLVSVSLIRLPETGGEEHAFLRHWTGVADFVRVLEAENWSGLVPTRHPDALGPPIPCIYPFNTIDVQSSGKVVACCRDVEGRLVLGDLRVASLREIWEGAAAREFRRLHREGRITEIPVCRDCDTPHLNRFHWLARQ